MEPLAYLLSLSLLITPTLNAQKKQPKNTTAMAEHYGHGTPPISPMKGMDGESFSIEPLKGHWTLLYFWADWCVPCVEEGIPSLTSFVNNHSKDRAAYSIVAIRFNIPKEPGDWNTFHEETEHLEKTVWHGVPPFPIVYDDTTRVTVDWGIHELPTFALIDPDGNLVPNASLSVLESALKQDLNKSDPNEKPRFKLQSISDGILCPLENLDCEDGDIRWKSFSLQASDGHTLDALFVPFPTVERSKKHFQDLIKDAEKILRDNPQPDENGKQVGERALASFVNARDAKTPQALVYRLFWTWGENYWELSGEHLEDVVALESRLKEEGTRAIWKWH